MRLLRGSASGAKRHQLLNIVIVFNVLKLTSILSSVVLVFIAINEKCNSGVMLCFVQIFFVLYYYFVNNSELINRLYAMRFSIICILCILVFYNVFCLVFFDHSAKFVSKLLHTNLVKIVYYYRCTNL